MAVKEISIQNLNTGMSKLSLKRKRTPILGSITSRGVCSQNRPTPNNRDEFFHRELETAIESTENHKEDCYGNALFMFYAGEFLILIFPH